MTVAIQGRSLTAVRASMLALGLLETAGCAELSRSNSPATGDPAGQGEIATIRQAVKNGVPPPAGSVFADTVVAAYTSTPENTQQCTATLLTNNWVLSAWHCHSFGGDLNVFDDTTVCTDDSQCTTGRGPECVYAGFKQCGSPVARQYSLHDERPGFVNLGQVDLWQLKTPFRSANRPGKYTIAQPVWRHPRATLMNTTSTIIGRACSPPGVGGNGTALMADFRVTSLSDHGYGVSVIGNADQGLFVGDSGGPGYFDFAGIKYLTGTTVSAAPREADGSCGVHLPGAGQHDIAAVAGWFDDTMFDRPRVMRSGVSGYAMALNETGAVAAFVAGNSVFYTACASEPCDARGSWSPPLLVGTPAWPPFGPAIAVDGQGAQIFVTTTDGVIAYSIVNHAVAGQINLNASSPVVCASKPTAHTHVDTNPPVIDVACTSIGTGSGGIKVYVATRRDGDWSSFQPVVPSPAVGLKFGSTPAIVTDELHRTQLFAVGQDGGAWMTSGSTEFGNNWSPSWVALEGADLNHLAAAQYRSDRVDLVAITSSGTLYHRIFDGESWSPHWYHLTKGGWSPSSTPFAASFPGKLGLLNVGAVDPWNTAFIQRYSDWSPTPHSTFGVLENVYNGAEWWGTMRIKNNGPNDVTFYKVEFDVPSGAHCTAEPDAVPPGATLSPLTGTNPPRTPSNHCVFTWERAPVLRSGSSTTFHYSTDSQSFTKASKVVVTDTKAPQRPCSSFEVTQNSYDGPDWWGTIKFRNKGPESTSNYTVEFDVPSGVHCTAEPGAVPSGATLTPLTGSNPPHTPLNHCVFRWTNTTALAPGATKTFNYSADSQGFSAASNIVVRDNQCGG